jgi:hypothetical protein
LCSIILELYLSLATEPSTRSRVEHSSKLALQRHGDETPELKVFDVTLSPAIKLSVQPSGADDNTTLSRQYRGERIQSSWIRTQLSLATVLPSRSRVEDISTMAPQYRGEHIRSGWNSNAALPSNYTFYSIQRCRWHVGFCTHLPTKVTLWVRTYGRFGPSFDEI